MTGVLDRFRLDGRVALVTGSARGLGLALARALCSAGAQVAVTSRSAEEAKRAADDLSQRFARPTLGLTLEVTQQQSVASAVEEVVKAFGRLDVLVNNAGTTARGPLGDLTAAQWDEVLDVNLRGAWLCCRAAHPALRASGGGRIINVASMFSEVALPNRSPYIASKGGLVALTRALAVELAPDRIAVNALCPGPLLTAMHDPAARAGMLQQLPLGRFADPEELGPAAVFLASEASSFMTGAALTVDGGYTAR